MTERDQTHPIIRAVVEGIGPVLLEQFRARDEKLAVLTMRLLALEQRLNDQRPSPPADLSDDDDFVQGEAR